MLKAVAKNRAIRAYSKKLPKLLAKDYGRSEKYTPRQVLRTAERNNLSTIYICYAFAMYCERRLFDEYHRERGEDCSYDEMRDEIAEKQLGANGGTSAPVDAGTGDSDSVLDIDTD